MDWSERERWFWNFCTYSSLLLSFQRFGIKLIDFYIQGIEVIGDNPEYLRIKEALTEAASLRIRAKAASESKGFYQEETTKDVIDKVIGTDTSVANRFISQRLGAININKKDLNESGSDLKSKLFELKQLYQSGLISEYEYNKKRKEILGKI